MSSQPHPPTDPLYESSLREMKWILVIWLVNFTWVIGYCSIFGYQREDRPLTMVLGMPSWVFWGVFVPWIVAAAASSWFALTQIEDHTLEQSPVSDTEPHHSETSANASSSRDLQEPSDG